MKLKTKYIRYKLPNKLRIYIIKYSKFIFRHFRGKKITNRNTKKEQNIQISIL